MATANRYVIGEREACDAAEFQMFEENSITRSKPPPTPLIANVLLPLDRERDWAS
jgi:hypothetical protein